MKNKNHITKIRTRYVKVSSRVFDLGLDGVAVAIYVYMVSCSEQFNPSLRNIAKKIGCSVPTVVKYINQLVEHKLIEKYEQGGIGKFTKYQFKAQTEWI